MKKMKVLYQGGPFDKEIWNQLKVTWKFVGRLCGSTPTDEDLFETWLKSRSPSVKPPSGKTIPQVLEEVANRTATAIIEKEAMEKRSTVSFQQINGKLVAPEFTIRAHIKDCTSQVQNQFVGRIRGERNFTTRVKNGLYVKGDITDKFGTGHALITRNGRPVKEDQIDGFQERTVHAFTPRGPISALKRFAFIVRPEITFQVALLGKSVKIEDLDLVLKYGATHGYGGERSMGEGRYEYTIEETQ